MDCRKVHQFYGDFIKKKLPAEEMSWIENHIQDCPDCYLLDTRARKAFVDDKTGSDGGGQRNKNL